MSGGTLVVLDRAGRENKQFDVPSGLVTLGSDPSCDVRILLPAVDSHHATIVVHTKETVIHNVGSGETLVNGTSVSVASLRQDDVVSLGGRELRWRYTRPASHHTRQGPHTPVLQRVGRARTRVPARRSEAPPTRAANAPCRNSTPGAVNTRQVAIVQPQRRDTANKNEAVLSPAVSVVTNVRRRRTSKSDMDTSTSKSGENRSKAKSPRNSHVNLQNTTKATLWIESRKTSPRKSVKESPSRVNVSPQRASSAKKSTPLRLTVLKKAQSAQKMRVTKIEAPSRIDHTKQAAIMLMTGHTPRKRTSPKQAGVRAPSFVVKKRSPVKSPRKSGRQAKNVSTNSVTNRDSSASAYNSRNTTKNSLIISVEDSVISQVSSTLESDVSASTSSHSSLVSNPKKSSLRDPDAKRNPKKTDSIKFDLSNLENRASNSIDVLTVTDSTQNNHDSESSEEEISLHYSDSSPAKSPSPRKPINSRSSKILEKTLGTTITKNTEGEQQILTSESPRSKKSVRGSIMLQKVLQSPNNTTVDSREATTSDQSWSTQTASGKKSETLPLRSLDKNKMESYSIVDLVSNDSSESVYNSVSDMSMLQFNTPLTSSARNTRSSRAESLLASSTPLKCNVITEATRSQSLIQHRCCDTTRDSASITNNLIRRSKSLSTPVNVLDSETFVINSEPNESPSQLNTKSGSRAAVSTRKSLPALKNNDTLVSVKGRKTKSISTSVNVTGTIKSTRKSKALNSTDLTNTDKATRSEGSCTEGSPLQTGTSTPENHNSPEELGTPMLRIQSLLDGTANLTMPRQSKKGVARIPIARKTISGRWTTPRKRGVVISKSFTHVPRASLRRSLKPSNISPKHDGTLDLYQDDGDSTPKSTVKLIQEGVKNKHSTAKQPKSKRSIIDNLNESDIVKQLFNSPVKRKLSQSMIEFSRKQLLDDEVTAPKKPALNNIASAERPDDSLMEQTHAFTPEVFVSPLSTPSNSPNFIGLKRLFEKGTPENDLRDVRGVGKLMRTPRNRKYVKNDLSDVAGVKLLFARSPRNRLSDVQVKDLFAKSPENDLRRVRGVRTLYRSQRNNRSPKNDLGDVAGVSHLFKNNSPSNELRNVSNVNTTMRAQSPKNHLSDLEVVRNIFRRERDVGLNNISGIEELFSESQQAFSLIDTNAKSSFDLLIGKPAVKVYPKAKSLTDTSGQKTKACQGQSLYKSFSFINDNAENWLENELRKRVYTADCNIVCLNNVENNSASTSNANGSLNKNRKSIIINKSQLITPTKGNACNEYPQSGSEQSKTSSRNVVPKTNTSVKKSTTCNEVTLTKSLNKSKNKINLSRELLKLATDTIEGNTPVLSRSRIRNSSLNKATELKKSTSEIYGAHTLPIKKRSLVDTSKRSSEKNTLPIKKRMLVHSTPVKARLNATASTLNATEIGCVSPIAATNETDDVNTIQNADSIKFLQKRQDLSRESLKVKPVRSRKTKPHSKDVQIESQSIQLSPRNKETVTFSPIQTRRTINHNIKSSIEPLNVKKRKKSLVITKKSPGYNPSLNDSGVTVKINPTTKVLRRKKITLEVPAENAESKTKKTRRQNVQGQQPEEKEQTIVLTSNQQSIETRSTRRQRVAVIQTSNKVSRAKATNVTKLSPQPKPKITKNGKTNALESPSEVKLRTMSRTVAKATKSKKLELSKPNAKGKKLTQSDEVTEDVERFKIKSLSKSPPKINENLTKGRRNRTEKKEETKTNSSGRKRTIAQVAQDVIEASESRTRSTRSTVANKIQMGRADDNDKTGPPKPLTSKETPKTASRSRKRKLDGQKSAEEVAAKLRKSNINDDIPRSSRRRKVEVESLERIEQNTRNTRMNKSNKLETDEMSSRSQSTSGNKIGKKINSRTIKTNAAQNTNTKNKTTVREESAERKIEVKRNTRQKNEQKDKAAKEVQKTVAENATKTSRGNKTAESEKPQKRQRKRKSNSSLAQSKDAPESPKRSAVGARVTRVTRARAALGEIDGQKPVERSRRR